MPLQAVGPSVNHIGEVKLSEHFLDQKGNVASGSIRVNHNTFSVTFENGQVNARFTSGNAFTNFFRSKTLARFTQQLQDQYTSWLNTKGTGGGSKAVQNQNNIMDNQGPIQGSKIKEEVHTEVPKQDGVVQQQPAVEEKKVDVPQDNTNPNISKKEIYKNGIITFDQKARDMFKLNLDEKASHCAELIQKTFPGTVKSLDKLKFCIKNLFNNMADTAFKTDFPDTEEKRVIGARKDINYFLTKGLSFLLHGDKDFSDPILKAPNKLYFTLRSLVYQLDQAESRQKGIVEISLAGAMDTDEII